MKNQMNNYLDEIDELNGYINDLKQERDNCFLEFNEDIPRPVKEARIKRHNLNEMGSPKSKRAQTAKHTSSKLLDLDVTSNKPTDIYYLIHVNCKYRKRIHDMLKELRNINQRRRDLEDKYATLKRDLNQQRPAKVYRPIKGDQVDELFAMHLNKAQLNLPVKRLTAGKYLFGTKQILAKIINGKLVIRVGGGYMSADEFIEQYGKIELMKMMKDDERQGGGGGGGGRDASFDNKSRGGGPNDRRPTSGRGMENKPAVGIGDMRDMMREQLNNVKIYENKDGNSGRRETMAKDG